jgi:hypothetical protein
MHVHTFRYRDQDDLIRQLDALLTKLLASPKLTAYATIRARYPHLKPSAFTMRLRRFEKAGGFFPRKMGPCGRKTLKMFVPPALDCYLRK